MTFAARRSQKSSKRPHCGVVCAETICASFSPSKQFGDRWRRPPFCVPAPTRSLPARSVGERSRPSWCGTKTGPTRPCWRGRQPLRRGLLKPSHPGRFAITAASAPRRFRLRAALRRCARRRDTFCRRSGRGSRPPHRRATSPNRRRRPRRRGHELGGSRGNACAASTHTIPRKAQGSGHSFRRASATSRRAVFQTGSQAAHNDTHTMKAAPTA